MPSDTDTNPDTKKTDTEAAFEGPTGAEAPATPSAPASGGTEKTEASVADVTPAPEDDGKQDLITPLPDAAGPKAVPTSPEPSPLPNVEPTPDTGSPSAETAPEAPTAEAPAASAPDGDVAAPGDEPTKEAAPEAGPTEATPTEADASPQPSESEAPAPAPSEGEAAEAGPTPAAGEPDAPKSEDAAPAADEGAAEAPVDPISSPSLPATSEAPSDAEAKDDADKPEVIEPTLPEKGEDADGEGDTTDGTLTPPVLVSNPADVHTGLPLTPPAPAEDGPKAPEAGAGAAPSDAPSETPAPAPEAPAAPTAPTLPVVYARLTEGGAKLADALNEVTDSAGDLVVLELQALGNYVQATLAKLDAALADDAHEILKSGPVKSLFEGLRHAQEVAEHFVEGDSGKALSGTLPEVAGKQMKFSDLVKAAIGRLRG